MTIAKGVQKWSRQAEFLHFAMADSGKAPDNRKEKAKGVRKWSASRISASLVRAQKFRSASLHSIFALRNIYSFRKVPTARIVWFRSSVFKACSNPPASMFMLIASLVRVQKTVSLRSTQFLHSGIFILSERSPRQESSGSDLPCLKPVPIPLRQCSC